MCKDHRELLGVREIRVYKEIRVCKAHKDLRVFDVVKLMVRPARTRWTGRSDKLRCDKFTGGYMVLLVIT